MNGRDERAVETRLLVEVRPDDASDALAAATARLGPGWEAEQLLPDEPDLFVLRGPAEEEPGTAGHAARAHDLVHDLQDMGRFERVEADLPASAYWPEPETEPPAGGRFAVGRSGGRPSQPVPREWAHEAIRVRQAWALLADDVRGAKGVRIGHPDTGFSDHVAILRAIDQASDRDILDDDTSARDAMVDDRSVQPFTSPGHGTSTGSVIVGRGADTDDASIAGVAPAAVLVPIRTMKSVIQIFDSDVAKAVDHARTHRCHVISMSLGGRGFFGLERAIRKAVDDELIVMAAAGNNVRFVVAPASYDECIAVAAVGPGDEPWSGSSRGSAVDVAAPGHRVFVANFDREPDPWLRKIGESSGTSYAVAHLAGVAALWLAFHGRDALVARYERSPLRLQDVFRRIVGETARRPPGWNDAFGNGIVDAEAVLNAPLPPAPRFAAAPPTRPLQDGVDRIAALLGEDDRAQVAAGLAGVLDVPIAQVPVELPRYEGEIAYLVLHDAAFRERVRSGQPRRGLGVAGSGPPPTAASGELAARLR